MAAWLALQFGAASAFADTGALHVEAEEPAVVSVDDVRYGPAPLDIANLPSGAHVVQVGVADGTIKRKVRVQAGQTETVYVTTPRVFHGARYRRGPHALFGVGAFGLFEINGGLGVGGQLTAGVNFGFTARHELRCVLLLGGGPYGHTSGSQTYGIELGFRPSYRKNLGYGYAVDLGARLSFLQTYYQGHRYCESGCDRSFQASASNLALGPDLSVLSYRMGDRKQYEFAVSGAVLFVPVGMITTFAQISLTFTYLLLPSHVAPRAL